jgi:hypothetical protein
MATVTVHALVWPAPSTRLRASKDKTSISFRHWTLASFSFRWRCSRSSQLTAERLLVLLGDGGLGRRRWGFRSGFGGGHHRRENQAQNTAPARNSCTYVHHTQTKMAHGVRPWHMVSGHHTQTKMAHGVPFRPTRKWHMVSGQLCEDAG